MKIAFSADRILPTSISYRVYYIALWEAEVVKTSDSRGSCSKDLVSLRFREYRQRDAEEKREQKNYDDLHGITFVGKKKYNYQNISI